MMITNEQRTILQNILDRGPNSEGNYADAYALILSWISDSNQVDENVKLWFMGAIQANSGKGTFSELIREYSSIQMSLRGVAYSDPLMQAASNRVAVRAIQEILNTGSFPDVDTIADVDAVGVGQVLFSTLNPIDTAGREINAGWSGAILFHAFDSQQIGRLLSAGDSVTPPGGATQLNRMDDVKNVLFAYYAYEQALVKAANANVEMLTNLDIEQWRVDLKIGGLTFSSAINANNLNKNFLTLFDSKLSRHFVGDAQKFGKLIEDVGTLLSPDPEQGLSWLISTYEGKVVTVKPEEFITKSNEFFSKFSAEALQSKKIQFVSDPKKLAEMAKTDVNARAALAGLSPLVMEVPPEVASTLTLYNPKTGEGEITDQWIHDRSLALSAFIDHWCTNGPATDIGVDYTVFTDMASAQEVQTFAFAPAESVRYVTFGSSSNDVITGGVKDDHLYGGAGADVLNGGESNDYLEGNSGDDKLLGGTGHDVIYGGIGDDELDGGEGADFLSGGQGKDTLDGGAGNDVLKGGEGDDTYTFTGNFGRDIIIDSEGANNLDINGTFTALTQLTQDSIIYYDDINNPTRKAVLIDEGNSKSLLISSVTKSGDTIIDSGNSVTIKNWTGTGFGIVLRDAPAVIPDTQKVFTVPAPMATTRYH